MLLPHYKRAEIALTDGNRRNDELTAERTGLFKQRDLMAALCSYDSCLAACYATADDHNVLRLGHRAEIILGLHAGQRIDHASDKVSTVILAYAALEAADAAQDIVILPCCCLARHIRVGKRRTSHAAGVSLAGCNDRLGDKRIVYLADTKHGNVHGLFDLTS